MSRPNDKLPSAKGGVECRGTEPFCIRVQRQVCPNFIVYLNRF